MNLNKLKYIEMNWNKLKFILKKWIEIEINWYGTSRRQFGYLAGIYEYTLF